MLSVEMQSVFKFHSSFPIHQRNPKRNEKKKLIGINIIYFFFLYHNTRTMAKAVIIKVVPTAKRILFAIYVCTWKMFSVEITLKIRKAKYNDKNTNA